MSLTLAGKSFESRLLLGTSRFPSPEVLRDSVLQSGTQIVTASLRRQSPKERGGEKFWTLLKELPVTILPNTAGCFSARQAVATAHLSREIFGTTWIKLEVIEDDYTLRPETAGLIEAAKILIDEGFEVFPYTTEELSVADQLLEIGCAAVMPWGSPIGSGQGLKNRSALEEMRKNFPRAIIIVDAGLGAPSHAAQAMEIGLDGALLNTAVAIAQSPAEMAEAFACAVKAGRLAFEAGLMSQRDFAVPSTPVVGRPFWHEVPQK